MRWCETIRAMHTKNPLPLELDAHFCFAMHSASLVMGRLYKPFLEALDLTYPQYLVLLVLWKQDNLSAGEIGTRLFLDHEMLMSLLDDLEEAGFVTRSRNTSDPRQATVALTNQGRNAQPKAADIPARILAATGCNRSELSALTQQIQMIRDRIISQN